jgi:hypothetical protein
MRAGLLVLSALLGPALAPGAGPEVVFEDPLKGKLADGWHWLREHPGAWRHSEHGLEIRVEPGLAATVKNALVRAAPDRSKAKYAVEVTVEFTAPPTQQYEQGGITWYQGDKPVFKLVHEFIDGQTYIIPGKKPTDSRRVRLRLVVSAGEFVAQYRAGTEGEFQTAASGPLPAGADERVSIQCYNGPPAAEHWVRFSDFRITRLAE